MGGDNSSSSAVSARAMPTMNPEVDCSRFVRISRGGTGHQKQGTRSHQRMTSKQGMRTLRGPGTTKEWGYNNDGLYLEETDLRVGRCRNSFGRVRDSRGARRIQCPGCDRQSFGLRCGRARGRDSPRTFIDPCTGAVCEEGEPCFTSIPGLPCDDGNPCTLNDECSEASECVGTDTLLCEDGDPCTIDSCEDGEGCVFELAPDETVCDDGVPCTTEDACVSGVCTGTPKACSEDENPCTINEGCDEKPGSASWCR